MISSRFRVFVQSMIVARSAATARRWLTPTAPAQIDDSQEFNFDGGAALAEDVKRTQQFSAARQVALSTLPPKAPPGAVEKVVKHLAAHPINDAIMAQRIVVTHVENAQGEEAKQPMPEMPLAEALSKARDLSLDLVQMAEKDGRAFCRLRKEKKKLLELVKDELEPAQPEVTLRESVSFVVRDVINAHTVEWKSRQVVEQLQRLHPVKLCIQQFATPESAAQKMKELMAQIKKFAEEKEVYHHYTGIQSSDRELAVTLSPSVSTKRGAAAKVVKHPSPEDWAQQSAKLEAHCKESRGQAIGTYRKRETLKHRNMGVRQFRTDKYGRILE